MRCLYVAAPDYENDEGYFRGKMACFISQFTLSGEKSLCGGNLSQKSVKYFWVQMKDAGKINFFLTS
ncbi:hypothetical protein MTBBW1_370007 [Desulfamplus magnetovallimortis]|uniref:Uncharacterized protein n=1 Tax=Desulfamplus magnetovallimortis TaxID=1246637 RepID=A0A1W1HGM8_9BACT|nr:hypothetical protein MTBBW1_370007 [Desulfamplus magnetovallimortis]